MARNTKILIGLVVLIIVGVGAYALFHDSSSNTNNSSTNSTNSTSNNSGSSNTQSNSSSVIQTKSDSSQGQYLATAAGLPLYTYKLDTTGQSNCTGACLSNWPAYIATSSTTNLPTNVSTITRSDNHTEQYTYKGMPLYTFTGDSANSAPTGNNVENFVLATP